MADTADLLVEIGTEELPPKALASLSEAFTQGLQQQLRQHDLGFAKARGFATPRRLAVLVTGLSSSQADKRVERRGPALRAAFDTEGNPTQAALGFARSCGVEVAALETQETAKGAWLVHRHTEPGRATLELIPGLVESALAGLPIPKRMRWGERSEEFVRPVHWVVLLFGDQVVPGQVMGLAAGRQTRGHRFHHPQPIEIDVPALYPRLLEEQGRVIADFDERRRLIEQQARECAQAIDAVAVIEPRLLDEVTALTEWPVALMGGFEQRFLEVPPECLVQAMQEHQKYFPVESREGDLLPHFIAISNIESLDRDQVRAGNERVIRPRFSDAAFFWEQDLKHPLEYHIEGLKQIKFQERLGSLYDKAGRIAVLADLIAEQINLDKALAMRAAWLCKCDLLSEMVGEFASLQGIMGRYYARHAGEDPQVAQAMEEVYMPRHAGDALPQSDCGRTIAIADRLDTLVGIFAIGLRPTGAKDPYGLRRAALGVLRILIETPLHLDLYQLLDSAAQGLQPLFAEAIEIEPVFDYMMERLKAYYTDRSIPPDSIDAVLARRPTRPADFDQRVRAVTSFRGLEESQSLAAANKRIRNILKKTDEPIPRKIDQGLLREPAERRLADELERYAPQVEPLFATGDYTQGMRLLAGLKGSVDQFFDQVMVMSDDSALRGNRLALLRRLEALFLGVADLSRLQ